MTKNDFLGEKILFWDYKTWVDEVEQMISQDISELRNQINLNEEKLDGNNGLLLSPHVDKLFDKGYISFTDDGKVLCANETVKGIENGKIAIENFLHTSINLKKTTEKFKIKKLEKGEEKTD